MRLLSDPRKACPRHLVGSLVALALCLGGLPAAAETEMFMGGPKTPVFTAPNGLFQLQIATDWKPVIAPQGDRDTVLFRLMRQGMSSTTLRVRRRRVEDGANVRHLMLQGIEAMRKELPDFTEVERAEDLTIGGVRGCRVDGSYHYQGNFQYPRAVEEIYLAYGNDAFTLRLDCFQPLGPGLGAELGRIYQSFVPRPSQQPKTPVQDDDELKLDNLPF